MSPQDHPTINKSVPFKWNWHENGQVHDFPCSDFRLKENIMKSNTNSDLLNARTPPYCQGPWNSMAQP